MIELRTEDGTIKKLEMHGTLCELGADLSVVIGAIYIALSKDMGANAEARKELREMLIHSMSIGLAGVDLVDKIECGEKQRKKTKKEVELDDFANDFLKFLYGDDEVSE